MTRARWKPLAAGLALAVGLACPAAVRAQETDAGAGPPGGKAGAPPSSVAPPPRPAAPAPPDTAGPGPASQPPAAAGPGPASQPPAAAGPGPASQPPDQAGAGPAAGSAPPPQPAPTPDAGEGAIEGSTLGAPSAQWSSWRVEGDLVDSVETVTGFITPIMEEHRNWSRADQVDVARFLRRLGYHTVIVNHPAGGGVDAVLQLEPVPQVRYIVVDIDAKNIVARIRDPIFADTIKRRMTINPGSQLEWQRAAREKQLQDEANRLAEYLRNDGFYDARVTIEPRDLGDHAIRLNVHVVLGAPYHVGRLTVTGNAAVDSPEVTRLFHHGSYCTPVFTLCLSEQRFTRTQLNKDVDQVVELYKKRGFPGVRVRTDFDLRHSFHRDTHTVEFNIDVRERRKIDVVFEGSHWPDESLRKDLTLDEEGSYDDVELDASAEAIRHHYQSEGYFEASVTWERVRFGVFERVIYTIQEGPKLKVNGIEFVGNHAVSDERLQGTIVTKRFRNIIVGQGGGFATTLQLKQDVERIERLYRSRGYRDAQVELRVARSHALLGDTAALAAAVAADVPADGLHIHFVIDEGPLYRVADVQFEFRGPHQLGQSALAGALHEGPGRAFIQAQAVDDGQRLKRVYQQAGYLEAQVDTETRPGPRPATVVVVHTITPNSMKRVGKIALRGNFKTDDWVIRDELKLTEGQPLTLESAERAQANLRSSDLFDAVNIDYLGEDDPRRQTVDVLVQVEERHDNALEMEVSGGYSTDSGWFSGGKGILANLWGTGSTFELDAIGGTKKSTIEGKLTLPRWVTRRVTGLAFKLELDAFGQTEQTPRFGNLITLGGSLAATKEYRLGALAGLGVQLRYDFRQRYRDINLVRPAGNSDDIQKTKVVTRSSTIGPVIDLDRRRDEHGNFNPLLAVKGYKIELRAGYGEDQLLGSARFVKLGLTAQHFWSLSNRWVLSNTVRYDHGIPLGGDVVLPEVERFFAGGDTTVRGFEQDRLATEVVEDPLGPYGGVMQFRVLPAGGNIRFIHNLDLQAIVWDDSWPFGFPLASAVFLDTGLVTNSLVGFQVGDLRQSLGLALIREVTPFGRFSIEYAVPLDPELGDDPRGRFHVNFGFQF